MIKLKTALKIGVLTVAVATIPVAIVVVDKYKTQDKKETSQGSEWIKLQPSKVKPTSIKWSKIKPVQVISVTDQAKEIIATDITKLDKKHLKTLLKRVNDLLPSINKNINLNNADPHAVLKQGNLLRDLMLKQFELEQGVK